MSYGVVGLDDLEGVRVPRVHTLELTDDELRIVHAALHSFLDDFGHDEADVLRRIRALIAKLPVEESEASPE